MKYTCIKAFDCTNGKSYKIGDKIDAYEYMQLHWPEPLNFKEHTENK